MGSPSSSRGRTARAPRPRSIPGWDPDGAWGAGLEDALVQTDVFLPNAAEACAFAGVDDPEAALELLAERIDTVAVKLGSEGAIARHGEQTVKADAPAVASVDGTGAGDSFTAGFLRAQLHEESLDRALRLGIACGSLSTRRLGGVDAQPRLDEAVETAERISAREISRGAARERRRSASSAQAAWSSPGC